MIFSNTLKPEGFEHEHNDCSVRTLSLVAEIPYLAVHSAFKEAGRKDGHGVPKNECMLEGTRKRPVINTKGKCEDYKRRRR